MAQISTELIGPELQLFEALIARKRVNRKQLGRQCIVAAMNIFDQDLEYEVQAIDPKKPLGELIAELVAIGLKHLKT